jgi:lactate 2-monooxygenase
MTSEDFIPSQPYGVERQFQIYLERRQGKRPTLPVAFEALEQQARAHLSPETWGFLADGAGSQDTLRANLAAFRRWRIVPRMLRDVSRRDLAVVCGRGEKVVEGGERRKGR